MTSCESPSARARKTTHCSAASKPSQQARKPPDRSTINRPFTGDTLSRSAQLTRKTKETDISLELDLDGAGNVSASTGVGFFDHMLDLLGRHGLLDLNIAAKGDLHIDAHHT